MCGERERERWSELVDVVGKAVLDSESNHEARIFFTSSFVDLTGMAQGVITVLSSAKCFTNRSSSSILKRPVSIKQDAIYKSVEVPYLE